MNITISLIQAPLEWHNAAKNRDYFTVKIEAGPKSDIWMLPEMFTTGFTMKPAEVAEPVNGETYSWLKRMAIQHSTHIGGSAVIEENGNYYNRFLVADPEGEIIHYDKRHLFTMAGENELYAKGRDTVSVQIKDWKVRLQVCYDLRFPAFVRNNILDTYDLLVYVANWPVPRIGAWDKLLAARAIENQCFVAGINRIGTDANGMEYNGHSVCLDPWGEQLAYAGSDETTLTVTLDKEKLLEFRKKFPVLNDADSFRIDDQD